MQIDKSQIIDFLRERGAADQAAQADQELPQQVDPAVHSDLLARFGIDPQALLSKMSGGGGGGLGDMGSKLGGFLKNKE